VNRRIPLDDKSFAIEGLITPTISAFGERVLVPFEVPGYPAGWESPFPAHLVPGGQACEIDIALKSQPEKTMSHEKAIAERLARIKSSQ